MALIIIIIVLVVRYFSEGKEVPVELYFRIKTRRFLPFIVRVYRIIEGVSTRRRRTTTNDGEAEEQREGEKRRRAQGKGFFSFSVVLSRTEKKEGERERERESCRYFCMRVLLLY